ncbi:hypothetical protein FF2_003952 [Malus domestica]
MDVINSTFKDDIPIALGLLVSELSEEPWKGNVSSHGDWHEVNFIQGEDVRCKPPRLIIVMNIVAPGRLGPAQSCTQPGLTVLSGFYIIGLAEDALGQDIGQDHVTEAAASGEERLAVVD